MSDYIDDGGPAFPVRSKAFVPMTGEWMTYAQYNGVTAADWFARGAMQSILDKQRFYSSGIAEVCLPEMAADCYRIADAMLAERAKREGGQ